MTYGHWLDQAAEALETAQRVTPAEVAVDHLAAAAMVASRERLYRSLVRLTDLIGQVPLAALKPVESHADWLVNNVKRLIRADPALILATSLRVAGAPHPYLPAGASSESSVARHLKEAADALNTAGDIVASHLGGLGMRPRTQEGRAMAMGAGRLGALSDIADLAHTALQVDRLLPRWLHGPGTPTTLRPLYADTVATMRWWTSGNHPRALRAIAARATGTSVVRLLDVAPSAELSSGPRAIESLHDVATATDAARAWIAQHIDSTGMAHVRAATRLAVTIAAATVRLDDDTDRVDASWQVRRWSGIAQVLPRLTDLNGGDRTPIVDQMVDAADWLRVQVRASMAAGTVPDGWPALLRTLSGSLPALAQLVDATAVRLASAGELYVHAAGDELERSARRGIFHVRPRWERADVDHDDVQVFLSRVRGATLTRTGAAPGRSLATLAASIPVLEVHDRMDDRQAGPSIEDGNGRQSLGLSAPDGAADTASSDRSDVSPRNINQPRQSAPAPAPTPGGPAHEADAASGYGPLLDRIGELVQRVVELPPVLDARLESRTHTSHLEPPRPVEDPEPSALDPDLG